VMDLSAFCLAYAAIACLCLAVDRHHREVLGGIPARTKRIGLRTAGVILLLLSYAAAVSVRGWGIGTVNWGGTLSVSAIAFTLLLPFQPVWALCVAAAGVLVTCSLWLARLGTSW
jgi:hypothetical protein